MFEKPIRMALIGAGAIAQTHAFALRRTSTAELACVVDIDEPSARAMAEAHGVPYFEQVGDMLDQMTVDGAIVCTPPSSHADIVVTLLQHDIHVLCEKPVAVNLRQANRMFDVASASRAKLTMASKFRHVPDVRKAKSLIASGVLGEIVLFENAFTANVDMRKRWNSQPETSGGGVLIDNGTHSVDIMRYFLGPLAEIQAVEGIRVQQLPVEDTVRILVRSESGVLGDIDLSWSINKAATSYVNIYGSDGMLMVGWKESKYRRTKDTEWTVFGEGYDKEQAFANQIDDFAAGVCGKCEFLVQPEDALASVAVVEKAYESLRNHRWHRIGSSLSQSDAVAC